jgi:RNA polymerase sigma-70 factor (ECF subfamily)
LSTSKVHLEEEQLVALLKQKDKQAFNLLYDNYSAALFGVVLKVVPSKMLAEDILQEVFLKIWRNVEQYDPTKGRLFTWMLNIARNNAIDALRSKAHKQEHQNDAIEDRPALFNASHLSTEQKVEHIGLEKWVGSLKEEHRVLIDLIYFQGYTQVEVAEKLQIPLGTVKTRIKIAINHLREIIQ